jgi:hypothetical protein
MAYKECENCGTRMYNGRCDNCHEELAIFEDQGEYVDYQFSPEFMKKVAEQARIVNQRRKP